MKHQTVMIPRGAKFGDLLGIIKKQDTRIAELEYVNQIQKVYTIQQSMEIAMYVLNQVYGFGAKRNKEFERAFHTEMVRIMEYGCAEDAEQKANKERRDIIMTREMMDRRYRTALGIKELEPAELYDARYAPTRLLRTWMPSIYGEFEADGTLDELERMCED